MQSFTPNIGLTFRTKLLTAAAAERFAKCLSANADFTGASVEESSAAKHPEKRFLVAYRPSNPERFSDMLNRETDKREDRAAAEGAGYVFIPERDGWYVLSVSGEVYEVSQERCSCPDHTYRCADAGLQCKHQIAFVAGMGEVRSW